MGATQSSHANEGSLLVKDPISGYPHGYLTFILDMIFPKWAVRLWVDNVMWNKRAEWKGREQTGRHQAKRGISVNRIVPSGSATEGLSLPHMFFWGKDKICKSECSDSDTLLVDSERCLAVDMQHACKMDCHLVMDTRHTDPGFVRIRVLDSTKERAKYCFPREVDGKTELYLSPEVKWDIRHRLTKYDGDVVITGPALTQDKPLSFTKYGWTAQSFNSIDSVYAIRCKNWPKIAEPFYSRHRASGWPSLETRKAIVDYGIHVVGVPHKFSSDPSIEWRLSYSGAEVYLANTLTLDQRQVYVILKYLSKAFLKGTPGFSSYLLKTVFFWTCEEIPQHMWKTTNLSVHLLAILDRMIAFIAEGHIPNYFIPDSNLIGHISPEHMVTLLSAITYIRKDPLKIIDAQENMRLVFHSFAFKGIFESFTNDLETTLDILKLYGFRPFVSITESIILFYANSVHSSKDYYCATSVLESYLRQFWLSPENKKPTKFEIAHKRRQLYYAYCRKRQAYFEKRSKDGFERNTLSVEDHIKIYSEGACRVDDTNGFILLEQQGEWESLMKAIINEWFSQYSNNRDYLKGKLEYPNEEFLQKAKFNEDDLPFYVSQPKSTQLYSPLADISYHKAIMRACQASWHLVRASQLKACDVCFQEEINKALGAFRNALPFAIHDPCVTAEYANLLVYLSSHPPSKGLDNLLFSSAKCSNRSDIQNANLTDLGKIIVQLCKEDPSNDQRFPQTFKTFSQTEVPALEANLAYFVINEEDGAAVPYDIYKLFLHTLLLVIHNAEIGDICKNLILFSKLGSEQDALLTSRSKLLTKINVSKSRSMIKYLHGTALLYCRFYLEAFHTMMQASRLYPECKTYYNTALLILALMFWEHVQKRNRSVVRWERGGKITVNPSTPEALNTTKLEPCHLHKDKDRDLEIRFDNESLVNDAVQRLKQKYTLDSNLDPLTFCQAYLDMLTIILPWIFDLSQAAMDEELSETQALNDDYELD